MDLTSSGRRNRTLAKTEDFERYAILRTFHQGPASRIEDYYLLNGRVPPNLRFVRFEYLDEDLPPVLREAGIEPAGPVPRINASRRGNWRRYFTRAAERAVYRRYQWVFDNGYYERVDSLTFPFVDDSPFNGELVPLDGAAHQVGPAATWWPEDGWIGEEFRVRVAFDAPTSAIAIEGWRPPHLQEQLRLELQVGESTEAARFDPGPFRLEIPYRVAARGEAMITLIPSRTWCPKENGWNEDERRLSVMLKRIIVIPTLGGGLVKRR
jgi:hypothetical protein